MIEFPISQFSLNVFLDKIPLLLEIRVPYFTCKEHQLTHKIVYAYKCAHALTHGLMRAYMFYFNFQCFYFKLLLQFSTLKLTKAGKFFQAYF